MRLHDYLEYFGRENPTVAYAEMEGASITYADANARANKMAHALTASGLAKGDRFAYLSKNSIDMALIYFAASKVGIIPVPLNYRLAPREWLYIINDAQSRSILCASEFVEGIDTVRDEFDRVERFVCTDGDANGWESHEQWLSEDDSNPREDVAGHDQLYQMYTSGTTGLPKGAMLSQGAVDNNLKMIATAIGMHRDIERCLVVAPMYHAAAGLSLMACASVGGTIIVQADFEPNAVVSALDKDRVTMATLVPAMIQACLVMVPDIATHEFADLRTVIYGASPIAVETLREAMATFKCEFFQGFGMTETTALATGLRAREHQRALAGEEHLLKSAGRAVLGTEVMIVDEDDNEVPHGEVGEVLIRGPQVMMGYWNLPEATEKSLKGGWMHTGDAAYMDDEGFIYIQDRIKDMIVSGGENIYPTEIENALFEHPAVADAAVIGVPSEQWGESVLAFIVAKEGADLSADEVVEFCRPRLAGFKIPRAVEFIDVVPRNASGKILKKDLREPYWSGVERRVS